MFAAYIVAAIVGGGLILFAAFAGLGSHADVSHGDIGHEAGPQHLEAQDSDHGSDGDQGAGAVWLPFFSIRFWTYTIATFGLVGSILTLTRVCPEPLTLVISVCSGVFMGVLAAFIVRILGLAARTSEAAETDFMGAMAKVTVAIRDGLPGKVRTTVRGDIIDLVALSDSGGTIEQGQEVMIVGIEGDKARVALQSEYLGE